MTIARALLLALLGSTVACKKDRFEVQNLNGGTIIVQGHGGMGIYSTYPLDSPASILACLHSGADGVEIDVQMTKDSVLIAYHSADLAESTDMSGAVVSHTWAELSDARFIGASYTEHRLMRMDQFFDNLDEPRRFTYSLDLKVHPDDEADASYMDRYARAVARLLESRGITDLVFLESQRTYLLQALRYHIPGAKLFIYPPGFAEGFAAANGMDLFGISIDLAKITAEEVDLAHDSGLWVTVWNAGTHADNREAIDMNPEIIQSDRVDHLVGLLD